MVSGIGQPPTDQWVRQSRPALKRDGAPEPQDLTIITGQSDPTPTRHPLVGTTAPANAPSNLAQIEQAEQPKASRWDDASMVSLFPRLDEIPQKYRVNPAEYPGKFLIDGKIETTCAGGVKPVYSKMAVRDGNTLKKVLLGFEPDLTADDAKRAVASASRAWDKGMGTWPSMSGDERRACISKFADYLESHSDRLALMLMWEIGKNEETAKKEVARTVEYLRATVEEGHKLDNEHTVLHGTDGKLTHHAAVERKPLGVTFCMTAYNYPVNENVSTWAPYMERGNVMIVKTPKIGSLVHQIMMEGAAQCFPPGAINWLPGNGHTVAGPIIGAVEKDATGRPRGVIDVFAFIGGEGAANAIIKQHPSPVNLKLMLGLGAKNAAIILPGANYEDATTKIASGALGYDGQRCTAEKMIFVPAGADGEAMAQKLADKIAQQAVGMPWTKTADGKDCPITPLPEDGKLDMMRELIDDAVSKGARVLNPGGGQGLFSVMRPAVLYPVTADMKIAQEEQFGPIVPIYAYKDVKEVIDIEKASPYGQQAAVWGKDGDPTMESTVAAMKNLVARVNRNDVNKRGPDNFPFSATDKSGQGTFGLRDCLLAASREVLEQSQNEASLQHS